MQQKRIGVYKVEYEIDPQTVAGEDTVLRFNILDTRTPSAWWIVWGDGDTSYINCTIVSELQFVKQHTYREIGKYTISVSTSQNTSDATVLGDVNVTLEGFELNQLSEILRMAEEELCKPKVISVDVGNGKKIRILLHRDEVEAKLQVKVVTTSRGRIRILLPTETAEKSTTLELYSHSRPIINEQDARKALED